MFDLLKYQGVLPTTANRSTGHKNMAGSLGMRHHVDRHSCGKNEDVILGWLNAPDKLAQLILLLYGRTAVRPCLCDATLSRSHSLTPYRSNTVIDFP